MLELVIIRHGQSVADLENRFEGRADFELTELGLLQAHKAAQWIAHYYPASLVISSPLKRAAKTAEIIAGANQAEIILDPDLMEWNNGLLAGLLKSEGDLKYPLPKGGRKPHDNFYETEPLILFRARAESFWSKLLASYNSADSTEADSAPRVCLVSHGGMINMLFQSFLRLPMMSPTEVCTGDTGIHIWQLAGEIRKIILTNSQAHLGLP